MALTSVKPTETNMPHSLGNVKWEHQAQQAYANEELRLSARLAYIPLMSCLMVMYISTCCVWGKRSRLLFTPTPFLFSLHNRPAASLAQRQYNIIAHKECILQYWIHIHQRSVLWKSLPLPARPPFGWPFRKTSPALHSINEHISNTIYPYSIHSMRCVYHAFFLITYYTSNWRTFQ